MGPLVNDKIRRARYYRPYISIVVVVHIIVVIVVVDPTNVPIKFG